MERKLISNDDKARAGYTPADDAARIREREPAASPWLPVFSATEPTIVQENSRRTSAGFLG